MTVVDRVLLFWRVGDGYRVQTSTNREEQYDLILNGSAMCSVITPKVLENKSSAFNRESKQFKLPKSHIAGIYICEYVGSGPKKFVRIDYTIFCLHLCDHNNKQ